MKDRTQDRRAFLRRLAAPALLPWLGCVPEPSESARERALRAPSGRASSGAPLSPVTRPVLLPWGTDAVHIAAPPREQPVAYVSMATRQLFVDHEYRDQVYWDLHAHISVSTGVWRLPLIGDEPGIPVQPGDQLREFEELSIRDWDPMAAAADGDIRILRGRPTPRVIDFDCAPLPGGRAFYRAGPWRIQQCGEAPGALCREDLASVGTGERFADRECTRLLGRVRVVTWACLEGLNPA